MWYCWQKKTMNTGRRSWGKKNSKKDNYSMNFAAPCGIEFARYGMVQILSSNLSFFAFSLRFMGSIPKLKWLLNNIQVWNIAIFFWNHERSLQKISKNFFLKSHFFFLLKKWKKKNFILHSIFKNPRNSSNNCLSSNFSYLMNVVRCLGFFCQEYHKP